MNLVMASVFLLAMLAFHPTLIYDSKKNLAHARKTADTAAYRNSRSVRHGKRHSVDSSLHALYSPALSSSAKLVLSMDSGDEVLVRPARGASVDSSPTTTTTTKTTIANEGKRKRGSNNKKLNRNIAANDNTTSASSSTSTSTTPKVRRKKSDKKISPSSESPRTPSKRGKGRHTPLLKSQTDQDAQSTNSREKKLTKKPGKHDRVKKDSSCRYVKSKWGPCNANTGYRMRKLFLINKNSSCPETKTSEKKCDTYCRYNSSSWTKCIDGKRTREERLISVGKNTFWLTTNCEPNRVVTQDCTGLSKKKPRTHTSASRDEGNKTEGKNKDKGFRSDVNRQDRLARTQQQHSSQKPLENTQKSEYITTSQKPQ